MRQVSFVTVSLLQLGMLTAGDTRIVTIPGAVTAPGDVVVGGVSFIGGISRTLRSDQGSGSDQAGSATRSRPRLWWVEPVLGVLPGLQIIHNLSFSVGVKRAYSSLE